MNGNSRGQAEYQADGLVYGVVARGELTAEDVGPEHGEKVFGEVMFTGDLLVAARD